jgi:RHS repeat-associated protein
VQLTNNSGTVTKDYTFDAFGVEEEPDGTDINPFRYAGEYTDKETGNVYLRARYYDPSIGRFMSEDSARDGLNWYVYANNNPIAFHDPTGLAAVAVGAYVAQRGGSASPNYTTTTTTTGWWFWKKTTTTTTLTSITVSMNGRSVEYAPYDYTINSDNRAVMDDSILFRDFATLSMSDSLVDFVASYEGYFEQPYRGLDSQNRTVGYGHVITSADGTKYNNGISKADAWGLLKSDLAGKATYLNNFLTNNNLVLNQNQYDALLSFTFNAGQSWIDSSTLRNVLLSVDFSGVGDAMKMWNKVNDNVAQGLVNRRADEAELFYDADYKRTH